MTDDPKESAFRMTMSSIFSGLINELATSVKWENDHLTAVLPHLGDSTKGSNEISATAQRDIFTTAIELTDASSIRINRSPLRSVDDLLVLGLNEGQVQLLKENLSATTYLEDIYQRSQTHRPQLLRTLEGLVKMNMDWFDPRKPAALAELFSRLPPREAWILSDTCGNIDGSTGNPLKNVMKGEIDNAIEHHPISVAFQDGYSSLHLIQVEPSKFQSVGTVPEWIKILPPNSVLVNDYTWRMIERSSSPYSVSGSIDAFTLMSKRSFIPLDADCQVKTSFPGQITSEKRLIDWLTARNVMYSGSIASQLAEKGLLPDHYWVLTTPYVCQVKNDDRTTCLLRAGLWDVISNYSRQGLPKDLTPITACALTSRNILTGEKTLFESLIEYGLDGWTIFQQISKAMISAQLKLIRVGWIPDSHTQNVVYLFDLQKKCFVGILNRDVECEKMILTKLRSHHLELPDETDIDPKLIRNVSTGDRQLFTLYFHHTIYTKHIAPMARILHEKYHVDAKTLCDYVKSCLLDWIKANPGPLMNDALDLSGRYYERNLACKTLQIGEPPHYRLIDQHPLLPQSIGTA